MGKKENVKDKYILYLIVYDTILASFVLWGA